ncbi:MAG: hypothetical protein KDD22_05465, partial [Bdellovibrionales bacterium]|nr:hypothetical protein [Bdellovibrionales bacterium]
MRLITLALQVLFCLSAVTSFSAQAVDLGQVEKDLKGEGALGWVHGADQDNQIFVFTVRNPENFFDS